MVPLVYNPAAGGGRGKRRAEFARELLFARGIPTRIMETTSREGAAPLVSSLARDGAPRILVLGGDGTLSQAAHGAIESGRDVALGFLPGGTGNSFLRDFGMDRIEVAAQRVAIAQPRRIDTARVTYKGGERHLIGVFGVGFMARVAARADREMKGWGPAGYTLAIFPELARFHASAMRLTLDGEVVEEPFALVAVCNAQRMGGAMHIAPMAKHDDGLLDVLALRDITKRELVSFLPRLFRGTHVPDPRVRVWRAAQVEIASAEPSPLLLDGEIIAETPASLSVSPLSLGLLL